jgi:uncharacterized phiE125 gp8 family phage protein
MPKIIIEEPLTLPVSVEEAKIHSRITTSNVDNDASIESMLYSATKQAENYTCRAFITQKWKLETQKIWPYLKIPRPPLQPDTVENVVFRDSMGVETPIDPDTYYVDHIQQPAILTFKTGQYPFPFSSFNWGWGSPASNVIILEFTAGYGDDPEDVPWQIKQGILNIFGFLYENRESQMMACGAFDILNPYRVMYL